MNFKACFGPRVKDMVHGSMALLNCQHMFISSASNSQRLIDPRLIMFTKRRQKNPINVTKKMSSGKAIRRPGCTQEPIKPRFSSLQWVTYGQLICYDDPRASYFRYLADIIRSRCGRESAASKIPGGVVTELTFEGNRFRWQPFVSNQDYKWTKRSRCVAIAPERCINVIECLNNTQAVLHIYACFQIS